MQRIRLTGTSCKSAMAVIELSVPVWGWGRFFDKQVEEAATDLVVRPSLPPAYGVHKVQSVYTIETAVSARESETRGGVY